MKTDGSPSSVYYPYLFMVAGIGLAITRVQTDIVQAVGRNAVWIGLPSLIPLLLGVWCSLQISKRLDGASLMEAPGKLGIIGVSPILQGLFAILFLGTAVYYNLMSGHFFALTMLYGDPGTQILLCSLFTALAALFSVEAHARFCHLLVLFVLPGLFLIFLTPLKNVNFEWIRPIVAGEEFARGDIAAGAWVMILSPLAACTLVGGKGNKPSFLSISVVSLAVIVTGSYTMAMGIGTFGLQTAKEVLYLSHDSIDAVRLENFVLERIIFLAILLWKYIQIIGSAFVLRCGVFGLWRIFGRKPGAAAILAVGIAVSIFSWKVDMNWFCNVVMHWLEMYDFVLLSAVPLLVYLFAAAKGRAHG